MNGLSIAVVVAGSLLAIGGADGSRQAQPAGPGQTTQAGPAAQAPADTSMPPPRAARLRGLPPQLDFRATTIEGRSFTGANLAERPVVFWFWAPWCSACVSQGPNVAKAAERYGDRVIFVGVAGLDSSENRLRQFISRTGTGGITQLDDRAGTLYDRFQVTSPASFLFLTRGGEVSGAAGAGSAATLDSNVRRLAGG
jgi:thiol-disulfide isomerase/thioredoxin